MIEQFEAAELSTLPDLLKYRPMLIKHMKSEIQQFDQVIRESKLIKPYSQ